jgi:hypothetical protein
MTQRLPISPAVFHLRHRGALLVASPVIIALAIVRILNGLRSDAPWLNWLAALVLWLFLLSLAALRRLELDDNGLHYRDFLTTDHIPWTHVDRLAVRKTLGLFVVEGLEARTADAVPRDRFIDLTQFSRTWRHEPLGANLRAHAPRLFEPVPIVG